MSGGERLTIQARLRLWPTEAGGRRTPILSGYRPDWNLGNLWLGKSTLNGAQVILLDRAELAPGEEAVVRLEPFAPEFWAQVRGGSGLPMHEGGRVVGHAAVVDVSWPDATNPDVAAFVGEARHYCAFVEQAASHPLTDRLLAARARLLALYAAATALPRGEPFEADAPARATLPHVEFESWDWYFEVFDPYEEAPLVAGSLSEDLFDTYADVREGLALWDSSAPKAAAVWTFRTSFEQHWGDHAIDALRALHRACLRAGARP